MRLAASLLILLAACSLGGDGDDSPASHDARPDASTCGDNDAGLRNCGGGSCTNGPAACCAGACTSCDWIGNPDPPPAEDGDTCSVSDWEHDFSCAYHAPEDIWLCCGSSPTGGTLCQYGDCPTDLGAPCCAGDQSGAPYVCTDGRWVAPLP